MVFDSKKIIYSAEDNWDEFVSITFVDDDQYLSLFSLTYENEIEIELNDQVNYVSTDKNDFGYELTAKALHVTIEKPIVERNFPGLKFVVNHEADDFEKLTRAMNVLVSNNGC